MVAIHVHFSRETQPNPTQAKIPGFPLPSPECFPQYHENGEQTINSWSEDFLHLGHGSQHHTLPKGASLSCRRKLLDDTTSGVHIVPYTDKITNDDILAIPPSSLDRRLVKINPWGIDWSLPRDCDWLPASHGFKSHSLTTTADTTTRDYNCQESSTTRCILTPFPLTPDNSEPDEQLSSCSPTQGLCASSCPLACPLLKLSMSPALDTNGFHTRSVC